MLHSLDLSQRNGLLINNMNITSNKAKKNINIFLKPWIWAIWIKSESIYRKIDSETNNQNRRKLRYAVNAAKDLATIFTLTNFKEDTNWCSNIENFFHNYAKCLAEIDLKHEKFSLVRHVKSNNYKNFDEFDFPQFAIMDKKIQHSKKRYRYLTHLDVRNYFNSIYLHSIEWDEDNRKNPTGILRNIHNIFMKWISNNETYGLPIGLNITVLLAEFVGYKITKVLSKFLKEKHKNYEIYRYVDDIFLLHDYKIKKNEFKSLSNYIYCKYNIAFHKNGKTKLNKYCISSKWPKNYSKLRKTLKVSDQKFVNNITRYLNDISLWHYNKDTFQFIKIKKDLQGHKKHILALSNLQQFIGDSTISVEDRLKCIKTQSLVKMCGISCHQYKDINKRFFSTYKKSINLLYKFYIKHINFLYSQDRNNLGILIYLKWKLEKSIGKKYSIKNKTLDLYKKWLADDPTLLVLVCSLFQCIKRADFTKLISGTFYDEEIDWDRVMSESKSNIEWFAISSKNTYGD